MTYLIALAVVAVLLVAASAFASFGCGAVRASSPRSWTKRRAGTRALRVPHAPQGDPAAGRRAAAVRRRLSARATLVAEPQVQAALRDLLSNRLWLKEHAATATLAELESARKALSTAKAALATQLERLADVRAELEAARSSQVTRADAHP